MRKMMAIPLLLAGCTSAFDIDMAGFSPLPDVEALDYSKVEPAASHTYWQLRYAFEGSAPTVLGAGGTLRRDQLDPAQRAELDAALWQWSEVRSGVATNSRRRRGCRMAWI